MMIRAGVIVTVSVAILLGFFSQPASAQTTTFWHNATELMPQDSNVIITPGTSANSMDVKMDIVDTRFIVLPLTLPSDRFVRSITICYQTTSANTFITQISLTRMTTPTASIPFLDDLTDLASTTPTCYTSTVTTAPPNYAPDAAINLLIRVTAGSTTETITIGGIGITVE